jgi:GNAT superfamily N-acetyltransferase
MLTAAASRARALAYTEQRLIVLFKDLDAIVPCARDAGVRLEDLAREHLPALAALNRRRGQESADRRFAEYVEQGFHGFAGYRGEDLIGYYWWVGSDARGSFPDLRNLGLGIDLEDADVYGSDFYLLPEHRGGGAAEDFLHKVEISLRERGYTRLWGYVASDNRPARWVYNMRGYSAMWIVKERRIAFRRWAVREPLS